MGHTVLQLLLIYPGRDLTVVQPAFPVRPVMQVRVRGQQFGRVLGIYLRSGIFPPNGQGHVCGVWGISTMVPPVLPVLGLEFIEQLHPRRQRTGMAIPEEGDDLSEQFFAWEHDAQVDEKFAHASQHILMLSSSSHLIPCCRCNVVLDVLHCLFPGVRAASGPYHNGRAWCGRCRILNLNVEQTIPNAADDAFTIMIGENSGSPDSFHDIDGFLWA